MLHTPSLLASLLAAQASASTGIILKNVHVEHSAAGAGPAVRMELRGEAGHEIVNVKLVDVSFWHDVPKPGP